MSHPPDDGPMPKPTIIAVSDAYYKASIALARAVEDAIVTPIGNSLPPTIIKAYETLKKEYHAEC